MRHHLRAGSSKCALGRAALLVLATGLLAGCETSGGPSNPVSELVAYSSGARASAQAGTQVAARAEAAKPPTTPKTRAQAAMVCWSMAEKSHAGASLEARADFVNKCIDGKLDTASADAKPKAAEPKTAEPRTAERKPVEAKPAEPKAAEPKPDAKPAAPKPSQSADIKLPE